MATDVGLINPNQPIQNGQVVVLPQAGQVGNQGSGGFVLSYPVPSPDRVQSVASPDTAQMQAGYRFRGEIAQQPLPMSKADTASAVGADIVLHYPAAGPGFSHVLAGISFGFAQTPTAVADCASRTAWATSSSASRS